MPFINPWTISLAIGAAAAVIGALSSDDSDNDSHEDDHHEENPFQEQLKDFKKLITNLSKEYGFVLRDNIDEDDMKEFMDREDDSRLLLLPLIQSNKLETTKTNELAQEIESINGLLSELKTLAHKYS